jgi:hydrogenase maturation factor
MLNVYDDLVEICASMGMNIIVFVGFIVSYLDEKRAKDK